jgi:hypothetical protein
LPQLRGRKRQEPAAAGAGGEGIEPPAEPVLERVGVTVDEAVRSERLERPRDLALLAAEQLGDAHDAQPAARGGLVVAEGQKDVEGTVYGSTLSNQSC